MIGEFVVVRTFSAGVHCGYLESCFGKQVTLTNVRRIWRWSKAFSLNEVANHGVGEDSRISEPTAKIILTEGIEVLLCTEKARKNLQHSRNGA
jgi:hypothetical protein